MAWQVRRGIRAGLATLRSCAVALWMATSAVVYGCMAVVTSLVSPRAARSIARLWCRQLLFMTGVRLAVEGAENIDRRVNYVYVANHQSHYDIPVLYSGLGSGLSFIAKKELFSIPFFGWGMAAIGCISMDRENPRKARASITRAVGSLKENNLSLVLFPEGTRNASGGVGEFKRASFTLALESGVPVVPVTICGTGAIHRKSSRRVRPGAVTLIVGKPMAVEAIQTMGKEELSGTAREIIVETMKSFGRRENAPSGQ